MTSERKKLFLLRLKETLREYSRIENLKELNLPDDAFPETTLPDHIRDLIEKAINQGCDPPPSYHRKGLKFYDQNLLDWIKTNTVACFPETKLPEQIRDLIEAAIEEGCDPPPSFGWNGQKFYNHELLTWFQRNILARYE